MKSFAVLLSLAACTLAQRLHVLAPTAGQTLQSGQPFTMELHQDNSLGPLRFGTVLIAVTSCFDVCGNPDAWGPSTILYNGAFNPAFNSSAPEKGLYEDLRIQLPQLQAGEAVLSVAHQFQEGGAELQDVFDYTTVHVNVQQ